MIKQISLSNSFACYAVGMIYECPARLWLPNQCVWAEAKYRPDANITSNEPINLMRQKGLQLS